MKSSFLTLLGGQDGISLHGLFYGSIQHRNSVLLYLQPLRRQHAESKESV